MKAERIAHRVRGVDVAIRLEPVGAAVDVRAKHDANGTLRLKDQSPRQSQRRQRTRRYEIEFRRRQRVPHFFFFACA